MRPPPDKGCHILRLPYELLKPIIADLSQRDQLSIAKTRVHLWELAYPLAYDRIVVEASPATADIVWRNLASGVCLRYVRHLEIRFPGQSIMNAETLYRAGDITVGILLAALRRHQLLSFSLTHPICTTSMMSKKNVILLLETQQQLVRVELPGIRGSSIRITNYLPKSLRFHQLRDITFQISANNASEGINSFIVQKSPNLDSIHLRFQALGEEDPSCIFTPPTHAPLSRGILFSMATRLTIHGCDFGTITTYSMVPPTFPALRALAVVDCQQGLYFFIYFPARKFPELRALMFTTTDSICGGSFAYFIEGLRCLRELIVYGESLYLHDSSSLLLHADTLEILSLHRKGFGSAFLSRNDASSSLTTLRALRHLSCYMGNFDCGMVGGVQNRHQDDITKLYENIATYGKLKTLGLHCSSRVFREYNPWLEPDPWAHLGDSHLTNEEISLVSDRAHSEKLIRDAIFSPLMHTDSKADTIALEYVSVIVQSKVCTHYVPSGAIESITHAIQVPKRILSFQPKQVLQSADQVKKEMMARYAGDNYYFLEAYIDSITEESSLKFFG